MPTRSTTLLVGTGTPATWRTPAVRNRQLPSSGCTTGDSTYLVLADAYVVLAPAGTDPHVITDPREVNVRHECTSPLRSLHPGPTYERARDAAIELFRSRRNKPGGYRVAKDDPQAAMEAVTGSVTVAELDGVALLSKGASRLVRSYGLATWPTTRADAYERTRGAAAEDSPSRVVNRCRCSFARLEPARRRDCRLLRSVAHDARSSASLSTVTQLQRVARRSFVGQSRTA